jgi:RecJ-like exonuclease
MKESLNPYNIYVISAGRYANLPFTDKQKEEYIFCVKTGEKDLYHQNGCKTVLETGKLIPSRNAAIDHAQKNNKLCIQISDDIKKVIPNKNFLEIKDTELQEVIDYNLSVMERFKATLVGIPPTSNSYFAKSLYTLNTFIIGDFFIVKPTDIRFDNNLTLKEDYDFTLQHISRGAKVIRTSKYLIDYAHYKNKGGAVSYRNKTEELKNIEYLLNKWGNDIIRLNPKRNLEILLNTRGISKKS